MFETILILGLIGYGSSFLKSKSEPQIGTQAYLMKKYPNRPFMRALDKSVMVETYRYVPWTEEEIEAFDNNAANKKYGYTYAQWRAENFKEN